MPPRPRAIVVRRRAVRARPPCARALERLHQHPVVVRARAGQAPRSVRAVGQHDAPSIWGCRARPRRRRRRHGAPAWRADGAGRPAVDAVPSSTQAQQGSDGSTTAGLDLARLRRV